MTGHASTSHAAKERVEMHVAFRRWWAPRWPKVICFEKATTRQNAVDLALELFEATPSAVAIVLVGSTWSQKLTRDDWAATIVRPPHA